MQNCLLAAVFRLGAKLKTMTKTEIRIECLTEILDEIGLSATPEQIQKIEKDFSLHIEMESEMSSYQHIGFKEECSKCKALESELKDVRKERDVYQNSVKQRRHTDCVWVENGEVMYGGR